MKNFIKVALIMALVLVILGSLCCAVSLGIGFNYGDFWADVEDGKYSFGPIDAIHEVTGRNRLNWQDDGESWKSADREDYAFQWSGDNEKDKVDKLDLEVYYGTVNIVENIENTETIQVTVEYRKKNHRRKVEAYKDGTTLRIEETGSKRSRNNDSTRITIQIPKELQDNALKEIVLEQDAGDINLNTSLVAGHIVIDVNAGECQADRKVTALEKCSVDVGAGEINLKEIEAPKVSLNANVGEIDIAKITAEDLTVDCGIGTIDAAMSGREQDYDYEIDCSVGEVTIGDYDYAGLGSKKKIDNSADKKMVIDCNVGEVDISFWGETD